MAIRDDDRVIHLARASRSTPILLACPDAALWSFDEAPIRRVEYTDVEHVRLTRDFLVNPGAFLRHL